MSELREKNAKDAISCLPQTNDGFIIHPGIRLYFLDMKNEVSWIQVRTVGYSIFGAPSVPYWINRWNKEPKDWGPVYFLKENALQARADELMKEVKSVREQIKEVKDERS